MSERKESSVLFSLRELQTIEEDRVSEEAAAAVKSEEDRLRATEAEAQRIRDEEEGRRLAAENSERQAREEVERRQREEQMRLEEAERRARVEAQAVVEQQRLAKEMDLRLLEQKRKKPAWIIAVVVGAVLIAGLVIFFQKQSEEKARAKAKEAEIALLVKAYQKEMKIKQIEVDNAQDEMARAFKQLEDAVDEKSRNEAKAAGKLAREALQAKKEELARLRQRGIDKAKRDKKNKARKEKRLIDKCAKSSDPLCGM